MSYLFIIDTGSYAGNFGRALCAYITGRIGDCGVGDKEREIALKELDEETAATFEYIVESHEQDYCSRPCSMTWYNGEYNSVEIYLSEQPKKKILKTMVRRAKAFCEKKKIPFIACRLIKRTVVVQEEEIKWE